MVVNALGFLFVSQIPVMGIKSQLHRNAKYGQNKQSNPKNKTNPKTPTKSFFLWPNDQEKGSLGETVTAVLQSNTTANSGPTPLMPAHKEQGS
jgi:hypothetical protein